MGSSHLDQVIQNNFSLANVPLIFGYGSMVVRQGGRSTLGDLVDIIMVVDDSCEWHRQNLKRNNQHYSFLKYLPKNHEQITRIQENFGARIYYNPYVRLGNITIKYGVIKVDHLINDLLDWTELYVAGRLHKPVEFIRDSCDSSESLSAALKSNRESALRAALLLLPEKFDVTQLYTTITGLSYRGDFRMVFGEDKNKVSNIVSNQTELFDRMYLPLLKQRQAFRDSVQWNETQRTLSQDLSPNNVLKNLRLLPKHLRNTLSIAHSREARTLESDAILASISRNVRMNEILSRALSTIVFRSSASQSCKGLLTAGLLKSIKYSGSKLFKSMRSRINYQWN